MRRAFGDDVVELRIECQARLARHAQAGAPAEFGKKQIRSWAAWRNVATVVVRNRKWIMLPIRQ